MSLLSNHKINFDMRPHLLLFLVLGIQLLSAQNAPNYEQAYGYLGIETSTLKGIIPAFTPGQYFSAGQLNGQAAVIRTNKAGQSLGYNSINLPGATESHSTDLVIFSNQLLAVTGVCLGCGEAPDRRAVFIALFDAELNQVATEILSPDAVQAHFDNPRLATDGAALFLAFNDEFYGGSNHIRAYDQQLNETWHAFYNLGFIEKPVSIMFHTGDLWLCVNEWNGFNSNIGTRLVRLDAQDGALQAHFAYPAYAQQAAMLSNGKLAITSVGNFYPGNQKIKLTIVSADDGIAIDSFFLGNDPQSLPTALCALSDGQLLLAVDEYGFYGDTMKIYRFDPNALDTPTGMQTIIGDRGAQSRAAYDLLPLSADGQSYIAVGERLDITSRGMLLASLPDPFTLQPPPGWSNEVCGTGLLTSQFQRHYPACLPQVYERVVYEQGALLYNGQPQDLTMDLYVPYDLYSTNDPNQKRPLLVIVHGGGFLGGNADFFSPLALLYAEIGYVVASINYRLGVATGVNSLDQFCGHEEEVFAAMYRGAQDTRTALQFLYDHADAYHIDREHIFALGHSAGAINVLNAAHLDADELPYNFESTLGPLPPHPPVRAYIPWAGALTTLDMIDGDEDTPMFFIHGTCDNLVPYNEGNLICPDLPFGFGARAIAGRKKELCQNYHLLGIDKGDHGMGGSEAAVLAKLVQWQKDQILCGQPDQTCEMITAANPGNCADIPICPDTEACITATEEPATWLRNLKMYPNPASAITTVEFPEASEGKPMVRVFNAQGSTVFSGVMDSSVFELKVSSWQPGVYFVEVQTNGGVAQGKLVVD